MAGFQFNPLEWKVDPVKPDYDPDRKVTLTIGELVNALADALAVVEDVPTEPKWKKGDHAYVEVEVTGVQGSASNGHVSFCFVGRPPGCIAHIVPAGLLQEIEE